MGQPKTAGLPDYFARQKEAIAADMAKSGIS